MANKPPTVEYLCHALPGTGYTGLSSFGIDQANELYLLKMGRPSKIFKIVRADEAARAKSITFAAPSGCLGWVHSPIWRT